MSFGIQYFKTLDRPQVEQGVDEKSSDESRRSGESGPRLLCKLCGGKITTKGESIEVDGRHQHTFFNPAGILFDIGCFAQAPGCVISGHPAVEFSWFKGSRWQYSSCCSCGVHLGWYFSGGSAGGFHGLIVNRLIEAHEEGEQE